MDSIFMEGKNCKSSDLSAKKDLKKLAKGWFLLKMGQFYSPWIKMYRKGVRSKISLELSFQLLAGISFSVSVLLPIFDRKLF